MLALLEGILKTSNVAIYIPAGVIAQAWRGTPNQARLARFLKDHRVHVNPLTKEVALACGVLCKQANTADVVDASVVIAARLNAADVISGDTDDLHALDPTLRVHAI
jgi:hypothetical protein